MIRTPQCLHIPILYENEASKIKWETCAEAQGYELEGAFDETIEQALHGQAWYSTRLAPFAWEELTRTWQEIQQLPAKGLSWNNLLSEEKSWESCRDVEYSWTTLRSSSARLTIYKGQGTPVPNPKGLMWGDIRISQIGWDVITDMGYSWEEALEIEQKGILWGDIRSVSLDWNELLSKQFMWLNIRKNPSHKDHVGAEAFLSLNTKQAQFRLRAYNNVDCSDYFTVDPQAVISIFDREDVFQLPVQKGKKYHIQLSGKCIPLLRGVRMALGYDRAVLELTSMDENSLDKADIKVLNRYDGVLEFTCFKEIPDEMEWSGTILLLEFEALATGIAIAELC